MPIRDEVINWFEEAKSDLKHAVMSLEVLKDYNWACFAAQQAVEKALKAALLHVSGELSRSHDLVKLYRDLKKYVDVEVNEDDLSRLSMYYTQARYPNAGIERPSQEITENNAKNMVEIAKVTLHEIEKIIRDP